MIQFAEHMFEVSWILGGSSHDLQVVNDHGDRKSPNWGNVPLPNGINGLSMGVTNYLLTGMILHVVDELAFKLGWSSKLDEQWSFHPGFMGGEILPSCIGIVMSHHKDKYEATMISWTVTRVLITPQVICVLCWLYLILNNQQVKLQVYPF